ncbi:class I SAM-dependent DNA methyltransferase [Bernardetia sp. OM2101]|uniref:HsdM family class I SAM-dependent methyltransferase n=1 Tax=Bernardetia sp. OM2101 TaxID=3344876 RepID=UPI0035D0248E
MSATISFLEDLNKLHFSEETGLVTLANYENTSQHPAEKLHIQEKFKKLLIDKQEGITPYGVLFRRFYEDINSENPSNSQPAVYIFGITNRDFVNSKEHQVLHSKIWSANEIEIYLLIEQNQIHIFNARSPANNKGNEVDLSSLELASQSIDKLNKEQFSAHIFAKGLFWEQEGATWNLDEKQTPFYQFLKHLEDTRTELQNFHSNSENRLALDRLLLLSILIMFLEEKKDKNNQFALKKIYEEFEVESYQEILTKDRNGKFCIRFLKKLASTYNGKIFDILDSNEIDFIENTDLTLIANFVEGRVSPENGQFSIWRMYSFDFLPVETISAIYENFLQSEITEQSKEKDKGVVYTPPFLVNFMIDEAMPLNLDWLENEKSYIKNGKIDYKILDPSCGSGVFLVAAYKRLLEWWLINNFEESQNKNYKSEKFAEVFKQILEDNIYGVDINKTAIQITIFSLTIAFLDKIDPKLLWDEFHFKNLKEENITEKNFFEWTTNTDKKFDLIIGNPPFNHDKSKHEQFKNYISKEINPYKEQLTDFDYLSQVPDNFAFYFLEFSRYLLNIDSKLCLIIPTTLLLYSPQGTSQKYRKALLEKTNVEKIFDFTHLRRILFSKPKEVRIKNKDGKATSNSKSEPNVCTIILNNKISQKKDIEHIVVKYLFSTEKKKHFEIDEYDRHIVKWNWAYTYPFIWKCNLLGGGRLFHLVQRLSVFETLNDFIDKKKEKNPEWIFEVGYEVGNEKNGKKAEYITNQDRVISIKNRKVIYSKRKEDATFFYLRKKEVLFTTPLLFFGQKITKSGINSAILESYSEQYLVFRKSLVGLHAPSEDYMTLQKISNRIIKNSLTYAMYILLISSKALVSQETSINKKDLEKLPFPPFEEEEYLELSEIEKILRDDVLNHYIHLGKSIKIGDDGYEPLEKKLRITKKEDKVILGNFGNTFCKILNDRYAKNEKSWQIKGLHQTTNEDDIFPQGFIIYQLGFGENIDLPISDIDEKILKNLISDAQTNRGAVFIRSIRLYEHINGYDSVFLIKPSNIRYWLPSIAIKDAGYTFQDLKKSGF